MASRQKRSEPEEPKELDQSIHRGVYLIAPSGRRKSWRARWRDPDSEKVTYESLDGVYLATDKQRQSWALKKAREIGERKMELDGGAPRKTQLTIEDGFAQFFNARKKLRPRTIEDYRSCADSFRTWAAEKRIRTLDQITVDRLLEFKDAVVSAPHSRSKSKEYRSEFTTNRILRGTSIVLRWLQERKKLHNCSSDDLKAGLKRDRATVDRIEILEPGQPATLLRAAIAQDRAMFRATREEHRGDKPAGNTPRYVLISPFVLFVLGSGMRFNEALGLRWEQVNLDALGNDGKPAGEVYLDASGVKTKRGREVCFDVSPTLRELLATLQENAEGERVFSWLNRGLLEAARKRLASQLLREARQAKQKPLTFSWQTLRRTTGSYQTNAPGIFGAAAAWHSAKRLGHSVTVAEGHYLGRVKGIPATATTIEAAMQIAAEAAEVLALARERGDKRSTPRARAAE